jgi:hypothetical protein
MAGIVVADTIQDGAGNSTAMDNAIYGSAKAWLNYNAVTPAVVASYNISSVTYNSTGNYTANFTNAFTSNKYAVLTTASNLSTTTRMSGPATQNTGSCVLLMQYPSSTGGSTSAIDNQILSAAFFR